MLRREPMAAVRGMAIGRMTICWDVYKSVYGPFSCDRLANIGRRCRREAEYPVIGSIPSR